MEKYNRSEELQRADRELQGDPSILGMTMLTAFKNISSSRATMNTSHLKQFVNIVDPDFPGIFMNTENLVGMYSAGYKSIDHESKVYRKIVKYSDIIDEPTQYYLFLYDVVDKHYYMVERKFGENLTEIFGYLYNNKIIDSYEEGDIIPGGTILYRSTSYDDDMLYGYGLNIPTLYTNNPYTEEDACIMSETFAKKFSSIECTTIPIGINPNEFMLNLYADGDEYKAFPDIGEHTKGELTAVKRTLSTKHILVDFKDKNLKKIFDSDTKYFKEGIVVDIDIYCNNYDEMEDGPFTHQLLKYIDSQTRYYEAIHKTCEDIVNSGKTFSKDIDYMLKRSWDFLDTESKWRDNDREFSGSLVHITVSNIEPGHIGQKFTGRSGNKSVVSRVVPDEWMPHYYDALGRLKVIHLLMSNGGIINRTTAFPPFEMFETCCLRQLSNRMEIARNEGANTQELASMMFEFINDLNEDQAKRMGEEFYSLSEEEQVSYIDECIRDRIYVAQSPYWEDKDIYLWYKFANIIDKYDWIKPDDIYINKYGREIKCLNQGYVGDLYVMKLKQSPKKGFSARGVGSINSKGLPERSYKNKNFTEPYSRTPIRFGELICRV